MSDESQGILGFIKAALLGVGAVPLAFKEELASRPLIGSEASAALLGVGAVPLAFKEELASRPLVGSEAKAAVLGVAILPEIVASHLEIKSREAVQSAPESSKVLPTAVNKRPVEVSPAPSK